MNRREELNYRGEKILRIMEDHVNQRLQKELKKWETRTDTEAKQNIRKSVDKYALERILRKGAATTSSIAVATHIAKPVHPDLKVKKSTNINVDLRNMPNRHEIGSHLLAFKYGMADTTGDGKYNAAAYELYLLLDLEIDGESLSTWLSNQDQDAIDAIGVAAQNQDEAANLSRTLNALMEGKTTGPATDTRAKQLYWLVGDDPKDDENYRLIAPLYATALTQNIYTQVNLNTWFFGDENKAARKALRERTRYDEGYKSYPNLAVQKFGGTKPQNISQLNSERRGENYLLASLPPNWQSREIYAPMQDAFRSFKRRPTVWQNLVELKRFLQTDPARNMQTRDYRDDLTVMLVDELMLFTFDMHSLAPGWSADEKCRLPPGEQYWLDPGRAHLDAEFDEARRLSNWHEEVSGRAADWLNHELNRKSPINLGDVEHRHWQSRFDGVMTRFRRQLDDLQDALRDEHDEGELA